MQHKTEGDEDERTIELTTQSGITKGGRKDGEERGIGRGEKEGEG